MFALVAALCIVPVACRSIFQGVVTLTSVVDSASKDYARLYNAGLVTPKMATNASIAHLEYRKSAGVARRVFEAVKAGQTADTHTALEAARTAANNFIDVIFPILPPERGTELRAKVGKAVAP